MPLTRPELFEDMGIVPPKGTAVCEAEPRRLNQRRSSSVTVFHTVLPLSLSLSLCSGVLLHGPPGTGKTLLARAVASASKATFVSVSGSRLVCKTMGAGPLLVRRIFEVAIEKAPSVVFIDEVDAVGGKRYGLLSSWKESSEDMLAMTGRKVVHRKASRRCSGRCWSC